jgi:formylglycine-generating enzyme required for sulfatase activity
MNNRKWIQRIFDSIFIVVLLVGCGSAPVTPTVTIAAVTPTVTIAPVTPTATIAPATPTETIVPATPTETIVPVTPTATSAPVVTQVSSKDGMLMVYVPAGEFLMGSDKTVDSLAQGSELPQHIVTLDAYWIDQTEVTNAMYALCVTSGDCTPPKSVASFTHMNYYTDSQFADYPMMNVDWSQADAYCRWAGRRLPTEAEWEKAARGTDGRIYPWGNLPPDKTLVNYNSINSEDTTKVGSFPAGASPYGAFDMAGNVWEWMADWYSDTYYQDSLANNPAGPSSGDSRVVHGGSCFKDAGFIRSAFRYGMSPDTVDSEFGFRCATSP